MKKFTTTTAMVALMTATLGLSAAAPAFAQDAAAAPQTQTDNHGGKGPGENGDHGGHHDQSGPGHDDHGPGKGGPRGENGRGGPHGMLDLNNPDAVEIGLVRLSQRIDLTPEQQPLFDTYKTAAMAAATKFSGVIEGLRPAAPVEGQTPVRPEISEMLANRITVTTAELDALKAVQPSAAAFFDSLTAEQLAELMPQRPDRAGGPGAEGPMGAPPAPMDGQAPVPPADDQAPVAPATNG